MDKRKKNSRNYNNVRNINTARNIKNTRTTRQNYPNLPTYTRQTRQYNDRYSYDRGYRYQTNTYSRYNRYDEYDRKVITNKKIYRPNKKPRNRRLNIISKLFTFVMFCFIISYFGVSVFKSMNKTPIDYETVEYGSIEDSDQIKGVIIRDEVVYNTSKNGILTFNISENERVKKGQNIATIKNEDAIKTAEEDVEAINEKILQLQEQRDELSIFYEDVKKIDSQMQKNLDNSISELSTYNISKIYELKDSLNKNITIRNQMLLSENTGSVKELSSQKTDKEQQINKNMENIVAKESGIVSYYTDGLEEVFTLENKDKLTKEQTLMKPEEQEDYKINVVEGDSVFKVVKSNEFYIASYIKSKSISTWKEGETRTIYVNDDGKLKPLEVIIEKIDIKENESYVLMKTNKNMIDFIDDRNVTFELSKPKEGFKINLNAISEEELLKIPTSYISNNSIIKKLPTGETTNVTVQTSGQDETKEYTYVSIYKGVIDIGDVIVHPETKQELQLNEIFTKKGIYVVNSGIYTFKSIDTQSSVQNDQFIILEPSLNTSIKLYDRYAPDISVVKGEEMVTKWQIEK